MKCVYVWMDACVGEVYGSSSAVRFTGGREARRGGEWMQLTPYVVRCVRAWRRIVSFRPIVYSSCTGIPALSTYLPITRAPSPEARTTFLCVSGFPITEKNDDTLTSNGRARTESTDYRLGSLADIVGRRRGEKRGEKV